MPGSPNVTSGSNDSNATTLLSTAAAGPNRGAMADDPIAGARRRDLLDDIVAADEAAAQKRERKERRIFRIAAAAVTVLTVAVGLFAWLAFTAIASEREGRSAAVRRIDMLNDRIDELGDELVAESRSNGQQIGELTAQIDALSEQVRQLGGEPVIVVTTDDGSRGGGARSTTTTSAPPASTTTTSTTSPPEPCDGVGALDICIPTNRRHR